MKRRGRGCGLMEPSRMVPERLQRDPPRAARSGRSAGSLGCSSVSSLQRQHVCLWRLQVNCSWGTKRRTSHHKKASGLQATKCKKIIHSAPPPLPRPRRMQMSAWINKKKFKKERRERDKGDEEAPLFVTYFGGKKTQVLWLNRERVKEFILHFLGFLSLGMSLMLVCASRAARWDVNSRIAAMAF